VLDVKFGVAAFMPTLEKARELAQAQGGALTLISSGPQGAVFELALPTVG